MRMCIVCEVYVFTATDVNYRHQWNESKQILYEWQVVNALETQRGNER